MGLEEILVIPLILTLQTLGLWNVKDADIIVIIMIITIRGQFPRTVQPPLVHISMALLTPCTYWKL